MKLFSFLKKKKLWEKYYSREERKVDVPDMSLYEFLWQENEFRQDNYALNYFGKKMRYRELFYEIELCAKALKKIGVQDGDVISICLPNVPEAVILFYAVSKIGAVANMIHPLSAEEEIKKSVVDTKSIYLFTVNFNYKKILAIYPETSLIQTILISPRDSMPTALGIGYFLTNDCKIRLPKEDAHFQLWKDFRLLGAEYQQKV